MRPEEGANVAPVRLSVRSIVWSQNAYPFATGSVSTVEATQRKGEPMDGTETTSPHHQLLHLVEAAQQAGYSEREIVEIVERELEMDADLDRAA